MRVCLVSRELAPFFGGGIGTYVSLMAKAYAEAGHEVHVLTDAHDGLEERGADLRPGVAFHQIDLKNGLVAKDGWPCWVMRYSMAVHEKLLPLHERYRFDLVEFPDWIGEGFFSIRAKRTLGQFADAVLAVRLHTPSPELRWCNHNSWYDNEQAFTDHMENTCLREADALLSPTRSLLKLVTDRIGGREGRLDRVAPYPFDDDAIAELQPEAAMEPDPAELLWEPKGGVLWTGETSFIEDGATKSSMPGPGDVVFDEPMTVLYFGRFEYRKGVHLLVEAGKRLLARGLDVRFLMIGGDTQSAPFGGSMLEYLKKQVAGAWEDRFVFERARPRRELGKEIRRATVCCFPSIWENFPNVCLESMMSGACVVGSSAGGMAEMIEDGVSGLIFESGSADSLETTLLRALSDEALRERCREGAPARIRELCDPKLVVSEMERALASARSIARPVTVRPGPGTGRGTRVSGSAPAVSIVIPYYNLGRYLTETLRSVREQTFHDYEIIIVDDGSTEGPSVEVLDRIERAQPDIRVVRRANGGLSAARNTGLREARGRYFLPLDADDLIHPTFIEKCVDLMEAERDIAYATSLVCYFDEDVSQPTGCWIPLGLDRRILPVTNCGGCCTALFRTTQLREIGGYDEWIRGYEDWDVYNTLAERGGRGEVLPEFLFFYRIRGDSMVRMDTMPRRNALRAYLLSRHPGLSQDAAYPMRLLLAEVQQLTNEVAWFRTRLRERDGQLQRERQRLNSQANDLVRERDSLGRRAQQAHNGLAASAGANGAAHDPHVLAQQIIDENLRYRVVDRLNRGLKAVGLQRSLKALTVRVAHRGPRATK